MTRFPLPRVNTCLLSVLKCQSVKAWFSAGGKKAFLTGWAFLARGYRSKCQGWDGKPMMIYSSNLANVFLCRWPRCLTTNLAKSKQLEAPHVFIRQRNNQNLWFHSFQSRQLSSLPKGWTPTMTSNFCPKVITGLSRKCNNLLRLANLHRLAIIALHRVKAMGSSVKLWSTRFFSCWENQNSNI